MQLAADKKGTRWSEGLLFQAGAECSELRQIGWGSLRSTPACIRLHTRNATSGRQVITGQSTSIWCQNSVHGWPAVPGARLPPQSDIQGVAPMPTFSISRRCFAIAASALLLFATSALAQLQTGNLFGEITDNQGAALPGVTVTLMGGPAPQVQITDAEGRFRFMGLTPGHYEVQAQLEGFSTFVDPNVPITVGRNTSLALTMSQAIVDAVDGGNK
jgi:Carboxypeptidase regulatory-like domain